MGWFEPGASRAGSARAAGEYTAQRNACQACSWPRRCTGRSMRRRRRQGVGTADGSASTKRNNIQAPRSMHTSTCPERRSASVVLGVRHCQPVRSHCRQTGARRHSNRRSSRTAILQATAARVAGKGQSERRTQAHAQPMEEAPSKNAPSHHRSNRSMVTCRAWAARMKSAGRGRSGLRPA